MSMNECSPFYKQLVEMYTASDLPVAITDQDFRIDWRSETACKLFPVLALPDGVLTLLRDCDLDKVREAIVVDGSYRIERENTLFDAASVTICALTACEGYLVLPQVPQANGTGMNPEGVSRMVCSFDNRYRTELSALFSAFQAMKKQCEKDGGPMLNYLEAANAGCYRLLRGCEWISYYTRLSSGLFPLKESRIELYQFLRDLLDASAALLQKLGIPLRYNMPSGMLTTACDTDKLSLVLVNLLSNSARYTRPGNEISVKVTEGDGRVTINVNDKGCGIPERVKPHIFEPYYSHDRDGSHFAGNGLGLPIAKTIIGMMGGTIAFTSEAEEGSKFTFTFPVVDCLDLPPVLASECADYLNDRFSYPQIAFSDILPPAL